MSEVAVAPQIDIEKLSPGQLAALFAQFTAKQNADKAARKAARTAHLAFLTRFVKILGETFPSQTFTSGAVGWSMGGTVKIDGRDARVSLLVRWSDTIPAKEEAEAVAAEETVADDATETVEA